MGGIRCNFRDCRTTTQTYPGLHFFRFPVSDKQRFAKWIEMAGAEHLLELPPEQQKCKLVCGRHFRYEGFMNYKMDRLVRGKAIPTLMRISDSKAYDFEQLDDEGNPKLIDLGKPKMKHLIPPDDFPSPFCFTEEDEKYTYNKFKRHTIERDELTSPGESSHETDLQESVKYLLELNDDQRNDSHSVVLKSSKRKSNHMGHLESNERPTKLSKTTSYSLATSSSLDHNEHSEIEFEAVSNEYTTEDVVFESVELSCLSEAEAETETETENDPDQDHDADADAEADQDVDADVETDNDSEFVNKTLYDEMVQHFENVIETEREKSANEIEKLKKENSQLIKDLFKTRLTVGKSTEQYNKTKATINNLNKTNESLTKQIETLKSSLEKNSKDTKNESQELQRLRLEHSILKEKHEKLLSDHSALQKNYAKMENSLQENDIVTTTKSQLTNKNSSLISTNSNTSMNKVQLFNGIKKYLNSSMIALLRMQMFGNSDREWKADERQVSIDLINLGENVYRNFADEWRFHLPSFNTAKSWSKEPIYNDEDDL